MDYENMALLEAEKRGVYQYKVTGKIMEYWTLYEDGFWLVQYNLDTKQEKRELKIPWTMGDPIPEGLETKTGSTLYNYFAG